MGNLNKIFSGFTHAHTHLYSRTPLMKLPKTDIKWSYYRGCQMHRGADQANTDCDKVNVFKSSVLTYT